MTADLTHIDTWLFDLDNTLYPEESGFMQGVESRMTAFVAKVTGLEHDAAYSLQKHYLAEHGLTLKGLMLHHGVDPADFHALFHDLSLDLSCRGDAQQTREPGGNHHTESRRASRRHARPCVWHPHPVHEMPRIISPCR